MMRHRGRDPRVGRLTATLVAALAKGGVIAIDGKSLNGAYEKGPEELVGDFRANSFHVRPG
jgi:hypothetical protein